MGMKTEYANAEMVNLAIENDGISLATDGLIFHVEGDPRELIGRASEKFHAAVSGWPAAERYGGLFLGPTGSGKSSAAAWAVRRWRALVLRENPFLAAPLMWLDAIEATDAERRYRLGTGDPADLALAYSAQWLVLDDVGLSTSPTIVQLVLARRYQGALPTLVTTGLTAPELVAHIGAASVRRIAEWRGKAGLLVDCHGSQL